MAADVVHFANYAMVDNHVDSFAVILNIEPVTDIKSLTVDRQRLLCQRIGNHERYQLFRELIRSVVVGTPGNCNRQAVGSVISLNQQIRRCLGGAVWRAGCYWGFLSEKEIRPVKRQVTVYFIGGNLMIAFNTVFPGSVHHYHCALDVGVKEHFGILY